MHASRRLVSAILSLLPIPLVLCSVANAQPMPLKDVHTWMYQTAKLESSRAISSLAATNYDMIVIDTMSTTRAGAGRIDMRQIVKKLRENKPNRIVLCYMDLARAEDFR